MSSESFKEKCKDILTTLDKAITEGPWEETNFLKAVGKKLKQLREDFVVQTNLDNDVEAHAEAKKLSDDILPSGYQLIYIAMYSFEGSNLKTWERIITNLGNQTISRPIYADEQDVKNFQKTKENKVNEGYVEVMVLTADIMPVSSEKMPYDKLGRPLVTLKDKSIKLQNVRRFEHMGHTYKLNRGSLVLV